MIIYFADRRMQILGLATTELREGFTISDDEKVEDTETGVATFECTIHWNAESRALAESCTAAGNYLLRSNNGENEFYTIIESENDTKNQSIDIYAEDAGMDLLNETVGPFEADEAHPAAWYVEMYAEDTGFEIGVNEIENLSRKLKWEGEATAAERLASVATEFDNAELSYSFEIQNLTITHKYINIWKKRGNDTGYQLRLNRDIDRIVTTTSVADLATALYVTGGTPEDSEDPITLEGYDYDDGDIYVIEGTPILCKRSALEIWSRYVWAKEPGQIEGYTGNIVKQWSYDTTSQSELCNRAITQLNRVSEPAVNYEIDIQNLPENVGIGDYVDIVDEQGELYLSSRILQLTTSVCKQEQTATLGEFLIKESGISETVRELADQFAQLAKSRTYYTWIAYADDEYGNGISLDPTGKTYMGTCVTTAGATPDISDPSVYTWALIQGNGVETINTYYGTSDSPTVVPDVWVQNDPPELVQNEYLWTYTETIYTNGVVELTAPHIMAYYSYLEVDELAASVANIENLLAGNAGIGDLQTIYLTDANAVIDSAVIMNALVEDATIGRLLAGYIYTDYIKISNNEDEHLLIDGSTIQISDGTYIRVQIGEDAEGDYNMYLWSADGELLWNALGLTEAGVSANGGIIKNVAVADDANISGYKLDIESVARCLESDGSLVINAAQVTIDDETLDYRLNTITDQIENLEVGEGVIWITPYYGISDSDIIPPMDEQSFVPAYADVACAGCSYAGIYEYSDNFYPAYAGIALAGLSYASVYDTDDTWFIDQPEVGSGEYLWVRFLLEYADGHTEWSDPTCLTDGYLRRVTTDLWTELEVVQGSISAKIWMSDIEYAEEVIMNDVRTEINMTIGEIELQVAGMQTTVDNMSASVATIEMKMNSITLSVESTEGNAAIKLIAGEDILGEASAREAFALEDSAIEITAGTVYFRSNTLLVDSDNLQIAEDGSIYATNAYLSGEAVTTSGSYSTRLTGGLLRMYYSNILYGSYCASYEIGNESNRGTSLFADHSSLYMDFAWDDDEDGIYDVQYSINLGRYSSHDERHLFYGGDVYIDWGLNVYGNIYPNNVWFNNNQGIISYKANGSDYTWLMWLDTSNYLNIGGDVSRIWFNNSNVYIPYSNYANYGAEIRRAATWAFSITPSAANTPTSMTITLTYAFPSTPTYVANARSSVIGTTVLGVSVASPARDGATVWLTRTNTTETNVDVLAIGEY